MMEIGMMAFQPKKIMNIEMVAFRPKRGRKLNWILQMATYLGREQQIK